MTQSQTFEVIDQVGFPKEVLEMEFGGARMCKDDLCLCCNGGVKEDGKRRQVDE